jgi:heparosan-N-sulfate-glucuronate 5-epimerase
MSSRAARGRKPLAERVSDFLSSGWSDSLVPGPNVAPGRVRGYHIDLRTKPKTSVWPPAWLRPGADFIKIAQWGLGSYERYLEGEGEDRLEFAAAAGRHLVQTQRRSGPHEGGWEFESPYAHTFDLRPPWLSAMAQGEGASLLVRLHAEIGEDLFAEAALLALKPMFLHAAKEGVLAPLGTGWFPQEYPTQPPCHVLNGGIFALWGLHDVWLGLADPHSGRAFEEGVEGLAANLSRWDTGYWSRYDLYPHPVTNVASFGYHLLHIHQLRAMSRVAPNPVFEETARRFEAYARSLRARARAFAKKATFRVIVPRNRLLARRSFAPNQRAGGSRPSPRA